MCGEKRRDAVTEVIDNLRQPMPVGRKAKLLLRNNWIKLLARSDCCGNYGEPGC